MPRKRHAVHVWWFHDVLVVKHVRSIAFFARIANDPFFVFASFSSVSLLFLLLLLLLLPPPPPPRSLSTETLPPCPIFPRHRQLAHFFPKNAPHSKDSSTLDGSTSRARPLFAMIFSLLLLLLLYARSFSSSLSFSYLSNNCFFSSLL